MQIYTLSLHDALPIYRAGKLIQCNNSYDKKVAGVVSGAGKYKPGIILDRHLNNSNRRIPIALLDRKSTRLNSSHLVISYAVFCLKKKNRKGVNRRDKS